VSAARGQDREGSIVVKRMNVEAREKNLEVHTAGSQNSKENIGVDPTKVVTKEDKAEAHEDNKKNRFRFSIHEWFGRT
jgi:hypothetical protein